MLWTAVSAVMLTVLKAEANSDDITSTMQLDSLPYLLISSASLTGLMLGLFWKRRDLPFFDEPGQMAFILHSIQSGYLLISASVSTHLDGDWSAYSGPNLGQIFLSFGWVFVVLAEIFLLFRFARKFEGYGRWGTFFRTTAIITLLQYGSIIVFPFFITLGFGPTGSLRFLVTAQLTLSLLFETVRMVIWFFVVRDDVQRKVKYHWSHWLGAITWATLWASTFISVLSFYLFTPEWIQDIGP